jgi:hypothetical protein
MLKSFGVGTVCLAATADESSVLCRKICGGPGKAILTPLVRKFPIWQQWL